MRIGLIGDFNAAVPAHAAIPKALALAAAGRPIEVEWLTTVGLAGRTLEGFDGVWCVPNSPYLSMEGALSGIRYARESNVPFLGTCGGFQHALIEFARNVLGHEAADHAESNPDAAMLLMAPLSCSLAGARGRVRLKPGSRANALMGEESEELYHCNYGLNPEYVSIFDGSELAISGYDENNEPRVAEIAAHPFFLCTLFQPERRAFEGVAHPLIRGFVEACARRPERTASRKAGARGLA